MRGEVHRGDVHDNHVEKTLWIYLSQRLGCILIPQRYSFIFPHIMIAEVFIVALDE